MIGPLVYTGLALDRAGIARRDEAWIAAALADPRTRVVPVWRDKSLIAPETGAADAAPVARALSGAAGQAVLARAAETALLGTDPDGPWFAADLTPVDETEAAALVAGEGEFRDLRAVGALLAGPEAALLAYARGIMHWHRRHRFCGICGSPTTSRLGGHVRRCADPAAPHEHFPRTDPAVIMLVAHPDLDGRGPACLLGRQKRWPDGMYSTLAGFVEPGESLEEAVAREVKEETGVLVADVRYRASQPWPFPSSLMLGFSAVAETTAVDIDPRELQDARWFRPREVRAFGEWGTAPPGEKRLPRRDSIARWLIEGWLGEVGA